SNRAATRAASSGSMKRSRIRKPSSWKRPIWAGLSSIMNGQLASKTGAHPSGAAGACLGRGRGCGAQCDDTIGQAVRTQEAPIRQQGFGRGEPAFVVTARIVVATSDLGNEALLELLPTETAGVGQAHDGGEDASLPGGVEARPTPVARQVQRRRE